MERRMRWKPHVRCEAGEKLEIISKAYLSLSNEYAMLREEGAKIVRITNPGLKIIESETESLLECFEFDYELVNYKRSIEEYEAQLAEMMCELWP